VFEILSKLAALQQTVPVRAAGAGDEIGYIPNLEDRSFLGALGDKCSDLAMASNESVARQALHRLADCHPGSMEPLR